MPLRRLFGVLLITFTPTLVFAQQADAQGLLRRLRNRIADQIAAPAPTNNPSDRLPARPLEPVGRSGDPTPAARYRAGSNTPTPAGDGSAVKQAGATDESPLDRQPTDSDPGGSFGRSILAPLGFDQESDSPDPRAEPAKTSLGIKAVQVNPGHPAVQVTAILPHSVADEAGLRVGDYIFAIDEVPTETVRKLADEVALGRPGQVVRLRVGRGGRVSDLPVQLVARPTTGSSAAAKSLTEQTSPVPNPARVPEPQPRINETGATTPTDMPSPSLGAQLRDVTGRRGVEVVAVEPSSPASAAGLQPNDRIISVKGQMVADSQSLARLVARLPKDSSTPLGVIRDQQLVNATLRLGADLALAPSNSAASSTAGTSADPTAAPAGGSLIGGLGAAFGGLFGSGSDPSAAKAPQSDRSASLPAPAAAASDSLPQPASESDPLALDPLPLEPSPESAPPATEVQKDTEALQAEIERLQQKLKSLKKP
ncbi:PDZ domain-containing protein [Stieleria sp. TO1_6]|uniref:PDZ domain-containing protein n=1 Tax=Stieleria tagensis TaxID=2956795 RepID=UPI00209A74F9|nr:PDZ domain-containing protein [Stieleria tagensis]MCO8120825.1 PDZ domain-containing protein [Stieleria tagensis]